jgi:FkbM family methyltransferase
MVLGSRWRDLTRRGQVEALQRRVAKLERALSKAERESANATVLLDYDAATVRLVGSTKQARKRRYSVRKEPFTVEWIESLPTDAVLYDIGANVGAYSLIGALRRRGPLRVIAFEPGFATFDALCRNIVLNDVAEHVVPLPVTLGARTEFGSFSYRELAAGAALHGGIARTAASSYTQPVLIFRLDELVDRFALPAPNHIKLDVDGAEPDVLQGARGLLGASTLETILVELSGAETETFDELLAGHGLERRETYRTEKARKLWYALYGRST